MRNLLTYIRIRFSMQTNAFLYYLSKLPVIRLFIPQNVYRYTLPKILVSAFGFILDFVKNSLVSNLATVLFMYWIPGTIMQALGREEAANALLYAFFFITVRCFLPALENSRLFAPVRDDILFLNHFMMDPEIWYRQKFIKILWDNGIMTAPALIYVLRDGYLVFCLVCINLAAIAAGDYLSLMIFQRKSKIPERKKRWNVSVLLMLVLYASCIFLNFPDKIPDPWILAGIGAAALAICVAFCIPIFSFRDYKTVAVAFASGIKPVFVVQKISGREYDEFNLKEEDETVHMTQFQNLKHLDSWNYFDRILKRRMRKAFRNQIIQSIISNTISAVVCGLLFRYQVFGLKNSNILQYSTFMITTVIGMTYGRSFLELCFRNMDAPLLYHHFYDAAMIRISLLRRFRFLMLNGSLLLVIAMADVCIFLMTAGTWLPAYKLLTFGIVFALIFFIFETFHLIAYYLLQPFTMDCTVKSPLFTIVNKTEGLLSYGILFIRGDITNFLIPLAIMSLLAFSGFLAVLHISPSTFKIRT
ncbi:MAG TPA: hypothetical protein GXX26_01255 [Clostridiaceae bacterium]|nr:hypothetical protein [Clostridiaceae bacterium]